MLAKTIFCPQKCLHLINLYILLNIICNEKFSTYLKINWYWFSLLISKLCKDYVTEKAFRILKYDILPVSLKFRNTSLVFS